MDYFALIICEVDLSYLPLGTVAPDQAQGKGTIAAVTWLPKEDARRIGLPRGSICGVLRDISKPIEPENFMANRDFVEIIHYLNAHHPDPALIDYASGATEESIAIIDERTADVNAAVPAEDILGLYEVQSKKVVKYQRNPNYRLVTNHGVFRLTPWLRKCLRSAVLPES